MAKEMVIRCDAALRVTIKDCGEEHDDTRTFTIRTDGEAWEVDLGGPHAEALFEIARRGRKLDASMRRQDHRSLDRRIRNAPSAE